MFPDGVGRGRRAGRRARPGRGAGAHAATAPRRRRRRGRAAPPAALALALLPWLHTRAAVIALVFGLAIAATASGAARRRPRARGVRRRCRCCSAGGAGSATSMRIYGTLDPAAPYGGYTQTALGARAGRRRRAAAGRAVRLARRRAGVRAGGARPGVDARSVARPGRRTRRGSRPAAASSRVAIAVAFVGYLVASASYRMWWGGASAPARFLVPMLLPLALPIGVAWSRPRGVATRALARRRADRDRGRHADPRRRRRRTAGLRQPDRGGRLDALGEPGRRPRAGAARRPSQHAGRGGGAGGGVGGRGGAGVDGRSPAIARGASRGPRARARRARHRPGWRRRRIGVAWRVDGGSADPRLPGGAEQAALAAWQRHPRATLVESARRRRPPHDAGRGARATSCWRRGRSAPAASCGSNCRRWRRAATGSRTSRRCRRRSRCAPAAQGSTGVGSTRAPCRRSTSTCR